MTKVIEQQAKNAGKKVNQQEQTVETSETEKQVAEEVQEEETLEIVEEKPGENPEFETVTEDEVKAETVTENSNGLEIGTASSTVISSSKTDVDETVGLVKIKISYPKDYQNKKFYEDDSVQHVSKELAEQFQALGIAKTIQ